MPMPTTGVGGLPLRDVADAPRPRVACLTSAATDIVAAMGLGAHLVGASHACDHPVAEGLPVLTAALLDLDGRAPAEIDAAVAEAAAAGRPLYRTDVELLARLRPDVVVGQAVCDVCAVDAEAAAAALPDGAGLVTLGARSLAGLADDLRAVGAALGAPERAEQQVAAVANGHARIAERVAGRPRPRVVTLEWADPPFVGGHWVPELVEIAGGHDALGRPGAPSRRSSWEEIAAADPDVVVHLPCGQPIGVAVDESRRLRERPEVAALRAVREARWWAIDATRLFSRCTPAVVTAAPVLAGILHPEAVPAPAARRAVHVSR